MGRRYRDREDYPKPAELTPWGLPASFFRQFELTYAPANKVKRNEVPAPSDEGAMARFRVANPGKLEEYEEPARVEVYNGTTYNCPAIKFNWHERYRDLGWDRLAKAFTFEEMLRFWWNDCVMSDISEELNNNPAYMLFHKISSSMWHWGWKDDWNLYVRYFHDILNFDFGIPGFETYIDFASWHNSYGYSQYARYFCDGALCYNIVYKGEHVLTIGYSASRYGILMTQVQMAKKKGNRWLYKLPQHYFDYAIERMRANFSGHQLWLATGKSMVEHVRFTYKNGGGPHGETSPNAEAMERVLNLYDRELAGFTRDDETIDYNRRVFRRLLAKEQAEFAVA